MHYILWYLDLLDPRRHTARPAAGLRHANERDAAGRQAECAAASHSRQLAPQTVSFIMAFLRLHSTFKHYAPLEICSIKLLFICYAVDKNLSDDKLHLISLLSHVGYKCMVSWFLCTDSTSSTNRTRSARCGRPCGTC